MNWKILLLCFISFQAYQRNDLSQFLNSVGRKITYVKGFRSAIEQVKGEPVTECPGIIVAVFSFSGKRLAINTCTPDDFSNYAQLHKCKGCFICFLVNKKVFVYSGASERN